MIQEESMVLREGSAGRGSRRRASLTLAPDGNER